MGNCPNPNCNGTLRIELDPDCNFEYRISCNTCPFWTYARTGEIAKEVDKVHREAHQKLVEWLNIHGLPKNIKSNWEEWEKWH